MGGKAFVEINWGKKARVELEKDEDVSSQNGVHLFSSSIETSNEVIDKDQDEEYNQVVEFI